MKRYNIVNERKKNEILTITDLKRSRTSSSVSVVTSRSFVVVVVKDELGVNSDTV